MISSSEILATIAQDLSKYPETNRAKKLVFYITQRYWETDFNVINNYPWKELLQNLYENNPTKEDLKTLLSHAVKTLNRKNIYANIAQYILEKMSTLYNNCDTLPKNKSEFNQFPPEAIDKIVKRIQDHEESSRLKKLIFAVYKQYWENDLNIIDSYDLQQILFELCKSYPHTKTLRKAFDNIVSNLNRQNFYAAIADTIVGELTSLYQDELVCVQNNGNEEEDSETRLISASKIQSKQSSYSSEETTQNQEQRESKHNSSQFQRPTNALDNNLPEEQVMSWLKIDHLFDLKQEIMQYSNPLRAKIILFYAVYQINPTEQHWSIVRTCTLKELLETMLQNYGENIQQIESELTKITNYQIEGLNSEENIQTIGVILEALKHFYRQK